MVLSGLARFANLSTNLFAHVLQQFLMQADSLSSKLLPRWKNGPVAKPANSRPMSFYSNIFEIKLKGSSMVIYQFSFDISPQLPQDSDGLIAKIISTAMPDLKKNIGIITHRGLMAWGRKQMTTVLTLKVQFTRQEHKHSYELLVKPIKSIGLESFMNDNIENLPAIAQVLNINIKQALRKDGMIELVPGSYFHKDTINENRTEGKLNVWRGHMATVAVYNKKLFLQVDPCSRVLRDQSFLQTMREQRNKLSFEEINLKFQGHPILRKYGSPKIYKIEEIDYKLNPKNTFYDSKEGKDVSYVEYFKNRYGVKIKDEAQPLIKVLADRRFNKSKNPQDKQYIYLVPEMVCLTGLTDEQRSNFRIMKSLGEFTKLSAQNRMQETTDMLKMLKNDEQLIFDINAEPKPLKGYVMSTPHIRLGKQKEAFCKGGQIKLKERVLDPYHFKDFIYVYSVGQYPDDDRADADDALQVLRNAGKTFGIKIDDPFFAEVKGGRSLNDWLAVLEDEKKKMGKGQNADMVFFLLKPNQEKFYGEIKKFVTFEFNCASQVARRKLLSKGNKGAMSAASKIMMQMNVKTGHPLWVVPNNHPVWKEKTVAVAGLANSKGKGGNTLGFVGTTNPELNQSFCDCKLIKGKQGNSNALYAGIFTQWLQNWFMKNEKKLPDALVLFREGLNEVQAKIQLQFEIEGLENTIEKVKVKTKKPNYNPAIIYILVNKKPNSRIFEGEIKGKNTTYYNPEPGSIIFEELSQGHKQFHLASATVREGTCTPVSFKVGYENKGDFPLEAIAELTYNQCYCYYNWTGSVRVPASLQSANKLAKLYSEIGDELKTESKNSDLKMKSFYL